mgnify:CR=1 FL=1
MADIRDTFIGNLRGTNAPSATKNKGISGFIQNFRNAVHEAEAKNAQDKKQFLDQPQSTNNGIAPDAAFNGARFDNAWNNPAENFTPDSSQFGTRSLSFQDVKRVKPYVELFNKAMNEYANEPDGVKRRIILDSYGNYSPLGSLPGMANYLTILRNTEDAVERDGIKNYKYADTANVFIKMLNSEIDKFNPRT